jgi:RNA-splicing ligase RtcB
MDRGLDHGHARIPGAHRRGPRRSEYEVRDDAARALPARVFADDELLAAIARDRSLEQLVNVTALPGLVGPVYGMPDMHEGGVRVPGRWGGRDRAPRWRDLARRHWLRHQLRREVARGSRGLGHQVCSDHLRTMDETHARYGIDLPDRQLACVPLSAPEGRRYLGAMRAAANFAFCNRQLIAHRVREVFARHVGRDHALRLVDDVGHNTAKIESHGGRECIARARPARSGRRTPSSPAHYRGLGQPVFIPASMGTASYVLLGTDEGRGAVARQRVSWRRSRARPWRRQRDRIGAWLIRDQREARGARIAAIRRATLEEKSRWHSRFRRSWHSRFTRCPPRRRCSMSRA